MIKFAIKSLVVVVLVGHAIKLAEPADTATAEPRFMPANYTEGTMSELQPDVASQLSTWTNAQIVVSRTARDAGGFCGREPLACQSGRELLARAAIGVRDLAAGVATWADEEEATKAEPKNPDAEYRPLEGYTGSYPILPASPPARNDTL